MFHFIVNPASRSGKGIEVWNRVLDYLNESGTEYDVSFSKAQGEVEKLVETFCREHADSKQIENLVILGGDGTLNEALQGITDFSKINLGYIPTGSSNDFARSFGYSDDIIEVTKRVLSGNEPKIIDLGKLEYEEISDEHSRIQVGDVKKERYFDVSCGAGFDAAICEKALDPGGAKAFLNKIGLGKLIYLKIALAEIFKGSCPNATLILDDGQKIEINKLRFVVGMNTCYEGGGYKFAPDAVPDDGYLDICQVNDIGSLKAFTVLPKASKGNHVSSKQVHIYHTRSFELICDEPMWVHTDGEVYTKAKRIKVYCLPKLLRLLY